MKLLIDENLPHDLRHRLTGHDAFTVAFMGWSKLENGELLKVAADADFGALITMDGNLQYQQNRATLPCSVVLLKARSNAMVHLEPLIPELLRSLSSLQPRTVASVGDP